MTAAVPGVKDCMKTLAVFAEFVSHTHREEVFLFRFGKSIEVGPVFAIYAVCVHLVACPST